MTIVWTDEATLLDAEHMNQLEQVTRKGVANGYASLGADGLVPAAQLPPIPPLVITDADIPASITRDAEMAAALATKADSAAVAAADALKVDKDSVVVAATRIVASKLLAGDAQPAFRILGDGKLQWGAGGATAPDTTLSRIFPGQLQAGVSQFRTTNEVLGNLGPTGQSALRLLDTDLYRDGPGLLRTDAALIVGQDMVVSNTPGFRLYFGSALEATTSLRRQSSTVIRADGTLDANALTINGVPVGGAALPADSVVVAGTRIISNKLLAGDAQPSWRIFGDGKMEWGPGGATAPDTSLYRMGGAALRTPQSLWADIGLVARYGAAGRIDIGTSATEATILFGGDTNLYRFAAGVLQTNTDFSARGNIRSWAGSAGEIYLGGSTGQPTIYFGSAYDTNLYRSAAGTLKIDGTFRVGQSLVVDESGGGGRIYFGSALDTSLYRSAANFLTSPGGLALGVNLLVNGQIYNRNDTGRIHFGTADDTVLYRAAANVLRTSGDFSVGTASEIYLAANGRLYVGAAGDTSLIRAGTGYLGIQGLFIDMDSNGKKLYFGGAADTSLYRSAANTLETAGTLNVGAMGITVPSVGGRAVVFGAPDSGGAGFRVMRVAN
jgi:hypothetical protein